MAIELLSDKIRSFGGTSIDTLNPNDKNANIILSNGNLTATAISTSQKAVRALKGHSTGKRQFEAILNVTASNNMEIGIGTLLATLNNYVGSDAYAYAIECYDGNKTHIGTQGFSGTSLTAGDIVGVCVDFNSRFISFFKNGWILGGTPAFTTIVAGTYYVMIGLYFTNNQCTVNFGATNFSYPIYGFLPWNTP